MEDVILLKIKNKKLIGTSNKAKNLTGKRIGRVSILNICGYRSDNKKELKYSCLCDCGNHFETLGSRLRRGHTKSCGCHRIEIGKKLGYKTGPINGGKNFSGYEEISGKVLSKIVYGAISRGLEIDITAKYIWDLFIKQNRKCRFSGRFLSFEKNITDNGSKNQTASLDRIDSSKGYIVGNVQWVHKDVNHMKKNMIDIDFIKWCRDISSNTQNE